MGNLADKLVEELNVDTVFSIGGVGIAESVVVTWIIMGIFLLICLWWTHDLRLFQISKRQAALEASVGFVKNMVGGFLGGEGSEYIPYLSSVLIYLGIANLVSILGLKPPTKDLNVTIALSLMSIVLIEYAGLRKKGMKGFLHSFVEPVPVIAPINVLEIFIRPLSLCMRLFGNVLGSFVIMALIEAVVPVFVPVVLSAYFDVFDGLIQAYVFVFLTALFIKESLD